MASYRVEFRPAALRGLEKLPKDIQKRVVAKVTTLANTPFPSGVKRIAGRQNLYRLRSGDYRIIYEVHEAVLLVLVVKVGPRRDVYRNI